MNQTQTLAITRRTDVPAAVAITLLVQTTVSFLTASVAVIAPAIARDRGWDLALAALYSPMLYAGAFAVNFRVAVLLHRLGGMGVALFCVAATAIGLCCLLSDWTVLAPLSPVVIGVGYGAMTPASSHILGPRTTPRNTSMIMSIKQMGVPLGAVLAGAVLPLLTLGFGWRRALLACVLVSVIMILALLPAVAWLNGRETKAPASRYRPLEPVKRLLTIPGMRMLLLATLVYSGMQLCLRSLLTTYLVHDLGLDLAAAGLALSVSQAAGMVGQVGWAWMADRVMTPHVVMALVGAVMTMAALAMGAFMPGWPVAGLVAVATVFGLSAAGFIPVMLGEVARQSPQGQVGALTSGANLFMILGAFLGPLAFGSVGSMLSYRAAFLGLAACTGAVALLLFARSGGASVSRDV